MHVKTLGPIFKVRNLDAALRFYREQLGCTVEFVAQAAPGEPGYAGLQLAGHSFHISAHAGDSAFGAAMYAIVDNVDAVYDELKQRGAVPANPTEQQLRDDPVGCRPTNQTWGMREILVRDPDGNRIGFGQPLPRD